MKVLRYSSMLFLGFGAAVLVAAVLVCPAPAAAQDDEQQADEEGETGPAQEPAEKESAENEPAENEPAENEPAENEPAEKESAENEPAENEPAEKESAENEPAAAGERPPSAESIALEAQQVHSGYCGSLQGTDRSVAGESFAVVGPIWSRVSDAYREGGQIFLLYWSGLLSECLGRYGDAVEDLEAFLADDQSKELVSMVADARSRLRRRARGQRGPAPRPRVQISSAASRVVPALIPGISLVAGGVVVGLAAVDERDRLEAQYPIPQVGTDTSGLKRADLENNLSQLEAAQPQLRVMGFVAAGLAISSAISFVVAGTAGRPARAGGQAAHLSIVPGSDGLYLGVSSRW